MSDLIQHLPAHATFSDDRMRKLDCFRSPQLLVGLNCFAPGQSQAVHTHADADKFYFVVSGRATVTVGAHTREVTAGDLILAPAGVPHGVSAALERTVFLVGIAPAP